MQWKLLLAQLDDDNQTFIINQISALNISQGNGMQLNKANLIINLIRHHLIILIA